MRKFFPHVMRGTALYQAGNVRRQRVGIGLHEQMHVIWLNCQFDNFPPVFFCHFTDDLRETVTYWPYQYLAPSFRAKEKMIW